MTEHEKVRLSNRIRNCKEQLDVQELRLKNALRDKKFWLNELRCAEAEFHGFKQAELSLTCTNCGD